MTSNHSDKPNNPDVDSNDELYKENAFSAWQKNKKLGLFGDMLGSPFLWAGTGIIILILILIIFWPKSENKNLYARLDNMAQRLDVLENRIFILETTPQSISAQPSQEQDPTQQIEPLQNRMEQLEAFLHHKTSQFNTELDKINKKIASIERKPTSTSVATKTPSTPSTRKTDSAKYHVVKPGETLYRISVNYGISVDKLLQMNNMPKDSVIHPGQKIMVSR